MRHCEEGEVGGPEGGRGFRSALYTGVLLMRVVVNFLPDSALRRLGYP